MAKTANVRIDMTADGKPIEALQRLIAQRIQYTNESAKEALAACAIQILISLRAITAVAKAQKVDMQIESALYASYFKNGSVIIPCIRFKGSNARYMSNNKIIWETNGVKFKSCQVFSFVDKRGDNSRKYFIVAPDLKTARMVCNNFITKRINKHKGLAKFALGKLMNKASQTSKPVSDNVTQETTNIANEVSNATTSGQGSGSYGNYSLTCEDNLDYAMTALNGGSSTFDMACQKAANKIASVLKRKIEGNFFAPTIETPFPELRSRK